MATIRKGDLVQVISGPSQARGGDRGKQGEVLEVLREENRILVQGINFVTKHVRVGQTQRGTKTGGIETVEAPIHISNVALVDPETKQPARTGVQVEEVTKDGVTKTVRTRFFKPSRRAAKPAKVEKAAKADKAEKAEKKPATKAKAAAPKKKDDE
ncbi:50S ribosomal protein L24 [Pseudoclavibacter sp. VKM Ac-2867]|nr:50S ribosomal protein L24 [Pseudoclavibacter sp. VKM Ac-2867]MBF4457551.1 50S ribosomal protein L24 [Pseudoclavibacter sp. VKM Ac-2867]